jgi:DNA-binding NarL/FixJ family response regulator
MAEGRSNGAIAGILVVSKRAVEKHVGNIFSKLSLPRRMPITAGCWPCSATWGPDQGAKRTPAASRAPGRGRRPREQAMGQAGH